MISRDILGRRLLVVLGLLVCPCSLSGVNWTELEMTFM